MKKICLAVGVLVAALAFLAWAGVSAYKSVRFDQDIGGHLKRAADANTVELATKEMELALTNIEQRNLTSGYTSIFYRTPDEDIEYWYSNLSASLAELKSINPNSAQLEKSNLLMKLRETLLDSGNKSTSVTCPGGISVYPLNAVYFWWGWLSFMVTFVCGCLYMLEEE